MLQFITITNLKEMFLILYAKNVSERMQKSLYLSSDFSIKNNYSVIILWQKSMIILF